MSDGSPVEQGGEEEEQLEVDGWPAWRNRVRRFLKTSRWFDRFWLLVIVLNCITLALEDPLENPATCTSKTCKFTKISDYVFTVLFVIEFAIKVAGLSFYSHREDAYIRDEWNVIDFLIVLSGLATLFLEVVGFSGDQPGVSGLRAFRLLRPLKAVQAFPAVRVLVQSILTSLPQLLDVCILYTFFLITMGIIAIQQWKGLLRWRCVPEQPLGDSAPSTVTLTSLPLPSPTVDPLENPDRICTDSTPGNIGGYYCPWGYRCSEVSPNPNNGKLSFDNIGATALTLFTALTLEGWTETMYNTMDATTYFAALFWVILIVFGAFFVLNLTIVIITEAFELKQYEQKTAAFRAIDTDGGGELDRDEVRTLMERMMGGPISERELDDVFNEMDKDGSGTVTMEEFVAYTEVHCQYAGEVLAGKSATRGLTRDLKSVVNNVGILRTVHEWVTGVKDEVRNLGTVKKRSKVQDICYQIVESTGVHTTMPRANRLFKRLVMLAIALNTITLAIEHHEQPELLSVILYYSNIGFTVVFTAEAVLKIYAMGPVEYFSDGVNCFDFLVVVFSLLDIVIIRGGTNVSIFRTFRVLRVLKLTRQIPLLQRWINILLSSMKGAAILTGLLALVIFIVALLGMQLFGGKFCYMDEDSTPPENWTYVPGEWCDGVPRSNYDSLYGSLLTTFQILTGEDWNVVMYTGMRAAGDWVSVYFVLYYVLGNYMMLNLFIAVLLSNRELKGQAEEKEAPSGEESDEVDDTPPDLHPKTAAEIAASGTAYKKLTEVQLSDSVRKFSAETAKVLEEVEEEVKRTMPAFLLRWMESNRSLFFFTYDHKVRQAMIRLTESSYFELLVMLCIALSTSTLAMESPLRPPDHPTEQILDSINNAMIWVFLAEAVFKCVAYGAVLHADSYLRRESWNRLDFFIVVTSIASAFVPGANKLALLKIMRTLRPLRFVNKLQGMKIVVQALVRSIIPLMNVVLISLVVWLIFGILGVQMFMGAFYRCSMDEYGDRPDILTKEECLNITTCHDGDRACRWLNNKEHFDHLPAAFLNLFEMASLEGWVGTMYLGVDSVSPNHAPVKDHNRLAALYFVAFIVFGAFFIINLFIGVLIDTYYQEKEKASYMGGGMMFLDEKQKQWVEYHRKMLSLQVVSKSTVRFPLLSFVEDGGWFEGVITICIILNILAMAMEHYPQSSAWDKVMEMLNLAFVLIFTLEAVLKVAAFGLKEYWKSPWNRFDSLIVILSLAGVLLALIFPVGPVASVFRVLRLARLLRMVKKAKGIKRILRTLYLSLPSLFNVAGILFLLFFIYSVLGVKLFARVKVGENMNSYANFRNFMFAILLLLRMSTGEAWQALLNDTWVEPPDCDPQLGECGSAVAPFYYVTFTLAGMYILLNLFIAVILDSFSSVDKNDAITDEYIETVRHEWNARAVPHDLYPHGVITKHQLAPFLRGIGPPLGPENNAPAKALTKFIFSLDLRLTKDGYITQAEALSKLFHVKYGKDLPEELREQLNYQMERILLGEEVDVEVDPTTLTEHLAVSRVQALVKGWLLRRKLRQLGLVPGGEGLRKLQEEARRSAAWEAPPSLETTWSTGPVSTSSASTQSYIPPPSPLLQWPPPPTMMTVPVHPPEGGRGVPLGLRLSPDTSRLTSLTPGSAAARAGLLPGMKVVAVGGIIPRTPDEAAHLISLISSRPTPTAMKVETPDVVAMLIEKYTPGGCADLPYRDFVRMCSDCHLLALPEKEYRELVASRGTKEAIRAVLQTARSDARSAVRQVLSLDPPRASSPSALSSPLLHKDSSMRSAALLSSPLELRPPRRTTPSAYPTSPGMSTSNPLSPRLLSPTLSTPYPWQHEDPFRTARDTPVTLTSLPLYSIQRGPSYPSLVPHRSTEYRPL